jgi:hypothetical protein
LIEEANPALAMAIKACIRNTRGTPWTGERLTEKFPRLKNRLIKKGVKFDDDACIYSCRHTYAKRTLSGY